MVVSIHAPSRSPHKIKTTEYDQVAICAVIRERMSPSPRRVAARLTLGSLAAPSSVVGLIVGRCCRRPAVLRGPMSYRCSPLPASPRPLCDLSKAESPSLVRQVGLLKRRPPVRIKGSRDDRGMSQEGILWAVESVARQVP